jgi:uncharacterized membrane protein required for colicin V production
MIAAAIQKPWYSHFAFNWFDVAIVLVLVWGYWRGRKRGMTKEFLPTLQWLSILLGAGLGHVFLADVLQKQGAIRSVFGNHFNERTAALMSAYMIIALLLFAVFAAVRSKVNTKLEGSNIFGSNEYYWGVVAGLLRYVSMILVALALLHAPFYSAGDVAAIKLYKLNAFAAGGHIKGMENDTGDFIPSIYQVQDAVFKQSLVGPFIKDRLSILLINTIENSKKTAHS